MADSTVDVTLSDGEASAAISGSFLLRAWQGKSTCTMQIIPALPDDAYEVRLQGSAAKNSAGEEQWADIGTFTDSELERIFVVDVTSGVRYKIVCDSGSSVRCVFVG